MKSRYSLLLKMQLYNFFGINRILHSQSKKEKRRWAAFGVIAVLVLGLLISYSAVISVGLARAGTANTLPTISVLICSLVTLILTFHKSSGVLIGLRDYDMVMSLPVKNSEVVLSRLTMVYLSNLLISIIVGLPARSIRKYHFSAFPLVSACYPHDHFSGAWCFDCCCFVPVKAQEYSFACFKYPRCLADRSGFHSSAEYEADDILDIGRTLSSMANRVYPPAALISKAVEGQSWPRFLLFAGLSVLIGGIFVWVVAHFYKKMNTSASGHSTGKYAQTALKVSSPFKAMYKREFDRYFSCTIYALNSTIGMVLLLVVSVVLLFISSEMIERQSGIPGLGQMLRSALPMVIAVFISMTSTASASLSLEGKSRWIVCSAPVRAIDIFHSKMAVNLTVICPFALASFLLLGIKMEVSLTQGVLLCVVPTVCACFISVLGMYMNVKFPKYDWTSEYYAVKGGAISVPAALGAGMLSSVIPLFICIAVYRYSGVIMLVTSVLLLMISFVLYGKLRRYKLYEV